MRVVAKATRAPATVARMDQLLAVVRDVPLGLTAAEAGKMAGLDPLQSRRLLFMLEVDGNVVQSGETPTGRKLWRYAEPAALVLPEEWDRLWREATRPTGEAEAR